MHFVCDRCGEPVEVSDPDEARCSGCGTMFDAAAIDDIQTRQVTQIPAATMQLAIKMLNRPAKWIHGQRNSRALVPVYGCEGFNMLFPLAAICQLAKSQGLRVSPLEQSEALWIPKAKTAQRSS
jgi:hypothetical protein